MLKAILNLIAGGLVLTGILFILGSLLNFLDIPFYTRNHDWSKDSYEKTIEYFYDGFIILIIGTIYFKYIEPKLPKSKEIKEFNFSICPNCKESFTYSELKDGKCKYCDDVDTIDIEEYYKNNPDEKDDG